MIENYTAYATVPLPDALEELSEAAATGFRARDLAQTLDTYERLVAGDDLDE